ncbi:anti-sigma factor family protein [Paenibacillus sp. CAU 1782]
MNCQEVMELMQRQLDDDLDESEIVVLMNHTRQCPDCAEMLERLTLLSAELTSLPKVVPSYSLVDAIMPELLRIDVMGSIGKDEASQANSQPETETVLPAATIPDPGVQRRRKRWRSWGSIGGVVAAGIVASIFMITYPPDFGSNANNSSGAAGDLSYTVAMQDEAASIKNKVEDPGGDASNSDVGIQSFGPDSEGTSEQEKLQTESTARHGEVAPAEGGAPADHESLSGKPESVQQTGAVCDNTNKDATEQQDVIANYDGPVVRDQFGQESFSPAPVGALEDKQMPDGLATGGMHSLVSSEVALSPDGLYFAAVNGFTIVVTNAESGEKLMETSRKNGEFGELLWAEDASTLSYEVKLGQGAIEKYVISAKDWTEKKASH